MIELLIRMYWLLVGMCLLGIVYVGVVVYGNLEMDFVGIWRCFWV